MRQSKSHGSASCLDSQDSFKTHLSTSETPFDQDNYAKMTSSISTFPPFDLPLGRRDIFSCFSHPLPFISLPIPWVLCSLARPLDAIIPHSSVFCISRSRKLTIPNLPYHLVSRYGLYLLRCKCSDIYLKRAKVAQACIAWLWCDTHRCNVPQVSHLPSGGDPRPGGWVIQLCWQ